MQLIGMLDSPYVRRVAISLQLLGLHFEHRPISVFRTFEDFRQINPVVKAPSLVCDDGEVLMDSTLIIEFAEALVGGRRSLMPNTLAERQHALRQIGLALAACEKNVSSMSVILGRQINCTSRGSVGSPGNFSQRINCWNRSSFPEHLSSQARL